MSKRPSGEGSSRRPAKKTRHNALPPFGAALSSDLLAQTNDPSSSALSTRLVTLSLPSLATLSARVFVKSFVPLFDGQHGPSTRTWLRRMPDPVASKLFAMLRASQPAFLRHETIVTYFIRGDSVVLAGEPGVTVETLSAIPRLVGQRLRTLVLTDFSRFSDATLASLVGKLHLLEVLNLRNCVKVGPKTAAAAAKSCHRLISLNLNNTNVTLVSLAPLILANPSLQVLKIAGIHNFVGLSALNYCAELEYHLQTDTTCSKLFSLLEVPDRAAEGPPPLSQLRSLKLRHGSLSDPSFAMWIARCPLLQTFDASFTPLRRLPDLQTLTSLQKLAITSTFISSADLVDLVRHLPRLKTLSIGALGVKPGANTMTSTAMSLNDESLVRLTDALEGCAGIENINLVRNAKLGLTSRDGALRYFVQKIGRKCKSLNLSGITPLRSSDLAGLFPSTDTEAKSPLHTLLLNKTGIDDDAAPWIASCSSLEALEVAETKFTADGLRTIISECPLLSKLNLTGCRGINVTDRRRFFEVWKDK
ncbi:RNI-like protein [Rickenella mellea]|uniref:RNI-like protein n=1 Tax=Rickenella mellea TaxID=50990 RepID=A0A4Y7QK30_9AGAM|nr:RNI-like protein [Rickenella mellea]